MNEIYDIFISYETTTGKSYAENLKKALEKNNGHHCFLADSSINKGEDWENARNKALEECKYLVVVITSNTMKSEEVKKEYEEALSLNKQIIPCRWKRIAVSETKQLARIQQIEFDDQSELANEVVRDIDMKENNEKNGILPPQDENKLSTGSLFYNIQEYGIAEKEYKEALNINPDFAEAHNNLGVLLFVNLGKFDEARKEFEKALKINPDYADAHYNLGVMLYRLKCPDETEENRLKRLDEAEEEYRKAITLKKDDAEEHNSLGILLADYPERMDEARKEYEEALKINPKFSDALYNLACWYSVKGNLEVSIEYLKKAIQLREEYKEKAKQDNDFISIRDTNEFKEAVDF